ncbi:Transcriptional regulator GlxA family, contains an amidase domain and an AraC-type DNA-binding HTH domain [Ferrimonas sediminum]|uniref:Transcriptional regulator GlxA family, contains an amidase domain and an AraC-type DNA-binding HTH domain n=1 Tax=Ferrimonas sediminum TaxID=718193 RepID=A0A1G8LFM7_9GAMM|nr:helix-turn-helix domain-containing protein [Ferrimonas sediminum]SDI54469.1 Transcriptional regulator GlxA family, contains an amidase domain and an AraC-type DNA-binding HTH domain [Ferrimonas sediminum]
MSNLRPKVQIALLDYPEAMQSSVLGFCELFGLAERLCRQHHYPFGFELQRLSLQQLSQFQASAFQVVLIPPCLEGEFYRHPDPLLLQWLREQHRLGATLACACAGSFIVAATGLLARRPVTTHWQLASEFADRFGDVVLNADKILIDDGDVISAGGLMAWLDLGLALVARFGSEPLMRQLGKVLLVDTGAREQRYYQRFAPRLDHGDAAIVRVQHHIQSQYAQGISVAELARLSTLTERTFLRRFAKNTGLKPLHYLQRLRIQQACDLLESTADSVELIAARVGYEDSGAFRRVFIRLMGLAPREFRLRFRR